MKSADQSSVKSYGREMSEVPRDEWPVTGMFETEPLKVWRSRDYMAVLYRQRADGMVRLTVNSVRRARSKRPGQGTDWRDGITWDELQRIKNECLGDDIWCVEVYPAQEKLVDVSNMRHLWVLDGPSETRFPEKSVLTDDDVTEFSAIAKVLRGMIA